MAAAWVLETARTAQQTALNGTQNAPNTVLANHQTRRKTTRDSNGHVKRLFSDKHFQSKPRYALLSQQQQQQQLPLDFQPAAWPVKAHLAELQAQQQQQQQQQRQQSPQARGLLQPKHRALAARLAAATEQQKRQQQYHKQQQQQQQASRHGIWSPKVAADIAAVCEEIKLPQAVATALSAAAAKGHISCNPGILLSQLLRLLPVEPQLASLLGREHSLASLLAAQPSLLRMDPQSLQANCAHLQELLGQQAAAAAVRRCPQVLGCSPFRMSANLTMLQNFLGYSSPSAAAAVAVRQPLLLLCTAHNLQLRWQQLQQLMAAVPAEKLGQQLRRTPELLLMRPSTLAGKLKCLELLFAPVQSQYSSIAAPAAAAGGVAIGSAEALGLRQESCCETVADATTQGRASSVGLQSTGQQQQQQQQQQVLRVYQQHQLSYRLQRLQQLAQEHGSYPPWQSAYGYGQSSSSSSSSSTTTESFHARAVVGAFAEAAAVAAGGAAPGSSGFATDPRVQHLALKVPGLLSLNPCTLHSHVVELQLLLALQPDDPRLTRLVLLQPGLLTQAPRTLANKLQLLQHLTGQSEPYVLEMVLRCPAVLTLSVETVKRKWGVLKECVGACGVWRQQLAAAPAVSVAMMLCYSVQRLQRLQYVVQLSQQQRQQQGSDSAACVPAGLAAGGSSSSSSGGRSMGLLRRRRQRRGSQPAAAAGTPTSSSSSSSSCAAQCVEASQPAEQQVLDLATAPWKSLIQESEAVFCKRFPRYKAWQQQQQL